MLSSKTFVKKTRNGGVLKVVREHYLRDDIYCGVRVCSSCNRGAGSKEGFPLDHRADSVSTACSYPHFLIPDTNIVLHQIDFLEDPSVCNVIVLQTVLQEAKHQSLSLYKRLRNVISQNTKSFFVFSNENHKDTYLERKPGESPNDHSDRSIRKAVSWYRDHLKESKALSKVRAVLLSDDRDNVAKATAEGLLACSVRDYASHMTDHPHVIDRVARFGKDNSSCLDSMDGESLEGGRAVATAIFEEHLSLVALKRGVESGKFVQGVYHGSRDNRYEGFVAVHGRERWVLVRGLVNVNRAVNNDVVAVEMLPEASWTTPSGMVEDDATLARRETQLEGVRSVDSLLASDPISSKPGSSVEESSSEPHPSGRVVGIVRKNRRSYCGTLLPAAASSSSSETPPTDRHIFIPADRRVPHAFVATSNAAHLQGKRIVVAIDEWLRSALIPSGHFVRELGLIGDKEAENEVLLLEHDVPYQPFSSDVLADLPTLPWCIPAEERQKRVDLRHLAVCSVDPPGCTDIDDALHCRSLEGGRLEVGVHIADVSHFIRPGSALDREAAERGTTVYLCDKRIDMVPELLSSNLCSLRQGEERLAFSCIWEMTPQADIVSTRFVKSIISSRRAFTYAEAQLRMDDASLTDNITASLRSLNALAKVLKQNRIDAGALTLASPEVRFEIDSETHDPIDLQAKEMIETNSLVEEFMLLANISVAEATFKEFPHCAMLRRHPAPPLSNYDVLIKAGKAREVEVEVESAKALAVSLSKANVPGLPYFNTLLRILATRCMMQALYFSSGKIPPEEFYHYGLASPIYTHFTSPIRRYADLMVHRLLAAAIAADVTYPDLLDKEKMQRLGDRLNRRHKMAQYAQRASIQLHTQIFFKHRTAVHEAYVLMVKKNSLQVFVPKYGYEGHILLDTPRKIGSSSGNDGQMYLDTHFSESNLSLSVEGHLFQVFDSLTVRLVVEKSGLQDSQVVLQLVSPEVRGLSVGAGGVATQEDVPPAPKRAKLNPKRKKSSGKK